MALEIFNHFLRTHTFKQGIFDHFGCIYVPYTSAGGVVQWADVMTSK